MSQYIDRNAENIITRISEHSDIERLKKQLDSYLFSCHCEKEYLSECEPEYCVYRYTDSCRYIKALNELYERFGINLRG